MKQSVFYKVVIVALLLLNTAVIGYLWLRPPGRMQDGPPHDGPPDRMIVERLRLDDAQQKQFEELKHEHHSYVLDIQKDAGELHHQLFSLLQADPLDTAARDSVITRLEAVYRRKELVTFDHFKKLRAILRPEQKAEFDDFVAELGRRLMEPPRPGGRP
jgi:Spy/CpxP family protein refolding chaperone